MRVRYIFDVTGIGVSSALLGVRHGYARRPCKTGT